MNIVEKTFFLIVTEMRGLMLIRGMVTLKSDNDCDCCSKVNGKKVTLPSLQGNTISVRRTDAATVIELTSHFQLSYSNTQEVIVTVSDSMVNKLCGACGPLLPSRYIFSVQQAEMQENMALYPADDFPSW